MKIAATVSKTFKKYGTFAYFAAFQTSIIYKPVETSEKLVNSVMTKAGIFNWEKFKQGCVYVPPQNGDSSTIVVAIHGKGTPAATMVRRLHGKVKFPNDFHTYYLEYPRFGLNNKKDIKPTALSVKSRCQDLLEAAVSRHPQATRLILIGESLGSGVLAELTPPDSLDISYVFIVPFNEFSKAAHNIIPVVPYTWVKAALKKEYNTSKALTRLARSHKIKSISLILAQKDETVTFEQGVLLKQSLRMSFPASVPINTLVLQKSRHGQWAEFIKKEHFEQLLTPESEQEFTA